MAATVFAYFRPQTRQYLYIELMDGPEVWTCPKTEKDCQSNIPYTIYYTCMIYYIFHIIYYIRRAFVAGAAG